MKILNFGSCNIDYVYSLNSIVVNGETTSAQKMETFPGGKGLNQSIACAKAGAEVYHAGQVGFDGKILIDEIIFDVGYENHTFFRKIFTKRYGITPNKYRKIKNRG